jgi:hypothetical protein
VAPNEPLVWVLWKIFKDDVRPSPHPLTLTHRQNHIRTSDRPVLPRHLRAVVSPAPRRASASMRMQTYSGTTSILVPGMSELFCVRQTYANPTSHVSFFFVRQHKDVPRAFAGPVSRE